MMGFTTQYHQQIKKMPFRCLWWNGGALRSLPVFRLTNGHLSKLPFCGLTGSFAQTIKKQFLEVAKCFML